MIRLSSYLLLLWFPCLVLAQPADTTANRNHFLPLIADGDGLRTLLFVTNVAETANRCLLELQGEGLDTERLAVHPGVTVTDAWVSMDLPTADERLLLQSVGGDTLAFGYGMMECAKPVAVRILLSLGDAESPLALTAADSVQTIQNFQLPLLFDGGRQGLILSNDTDFEAACAVELKDVAGAVESRSDVFVAADSVLWKAVEDFVVIPESWSEGSVKLACDRELGVLGLSRNGAGFMALPVIGLDDEPIGKTSALLPLIADGDGFRSRLLITNLTDTANRCTLELHGESLDGSRFDNWSGAADTTGTVLELTHRAEQHALVSRNAAGLAFGYGFLQCDAPADIRNLLSTGMEGSPTGMASIAAAQQSDQFEFPVAPLAGRLALVFSNDTASGAVCSVELQVLDSTRTSEGTRQVRVPAKSTMVGFLEDGFGPRTAEFPGGLAAVSCDTEVGALSLPVSDAVFAALPPVVFSALVRTSGATPVFGNLTLPEFKIYPVDEAIDPWQLPAASGGDAPLRYSLQPEVPGLRFDPVTRQLSGTPTVAGLYLMQHGVTDADGDSDIHEFAIWVKAPDTVPDFASSPPDQAYRLDQPIEPLQLPVATGGNEPVAYFLDALVPGLYFDDETRQLKGTPMETGIYKLTYRAFDDDFDTDAVSFVVTVTVPVSAASSLPAAGCADGTFVDEPEINAGLVTDCQALVDFANALIRNGLHPPDNVIRQWGSGRQQKLDRWQGIELAAGRVARVELPFGELKGDLPSDLTRLGALQVLNLLDNELTGRIPPGLGELSRLKMLDLGLNLLNGPIPPELGRLDQLTYLNLGGNELSGAMPPELGRLDRLTYLSLASNELTGPIPSELGQLSQLNSLSLDDNRLSGTIPPELGQLDRLTSLNLARNELSGPIPAALGRLVQLTSLDLASNALDGPIPPTIGQLTRLEFLFLSNNQLSGMLSAELGKLDNLRVLNISFNPLHGTLPWVFREQVSSGELTLPTDGTLISGFEAPPQRARNPAYSTTAAANGNASFYSTAWFQGPLVLEWSGRGEQVEYQTPLLGRWATLAVQVDHQVAYPPRLITQVLDASGQVLADSLASAAPAVTSLVESGHWRTEYLFDLPGSLFQAGNRVVHIIDPDDELAETDESDNRSNPFIIHGEQPPPFRATFIPLRLSDQEDTGWSENLDPALLMSGTLAMLPIADNFKARIGSPLAMEGQSIDQTLLDLLALWNLEAEPDEFYHGITMEPVGGVALLGARVAVSTLSVHSVIPHEFGHNFNLRHTPGCFAEGLDQDYPFPDGQLGLLPGWDRNWRRFMSGAAGKRADLMSYCGDSRFISAYNYRLATEYWLSLRDGMGDTGMAPMGVDNSTTAVADAKADAQPLAGSTGVLSEQPPPAARGTDSAHGSPPAAAEPVSSLALSGRVAADGSWQLRQAQLSTRAPRSPPDNAPFVLMLLDRAGVPLYTEPLALLPMSQGTGLLWAARLPLLQAVHAIAIRDGRGNVLLQQPLPALY